VSDCQIYVTMPPTTAHSQRHLYFTWQCMTCKATGDDMWDQSKCPQWDEGPDPTVRPLPRILVEMANERIAELRADIAGLDGQIETYDHEAAKLTRLMEDRDTLRAQIKEIEDAING
jgi:hypothetical protein